MRGARRDCRRGRRGASPRGASLCEWGERERSALEWGRGKKEWRKSREASIVESGMIEIVGREGCEGGDRKRTFVVFVGWWQEVRWNFDVWDKGARDEYHIDLRWHTILELTWLGEIPSQSFVEFVEEMVGARVRNVKIIERIVLQIWLAFFLVFLESWRGDSLP